jgi:lycopene beta-cyclase
VKLGLPVTTWQVSPPPGVSVQVPSVGVGVGVAVAGRVFVGVTGVVTEVVGGVVTAVVGAVVGGVVTGVVGGLTGVVGGVTGLVGGIVGHGRGPLHGGGGGGGCGGKMHAKAVPEETRTNAAAATSGSTTRRVEGQGRGRVGEVATGEAPSLGAGMLWDIGENPFRGWRHPAVALVRPDPMTAASLRLVVRFLGKPGKKLLSVIQWAQNRVGRASSEVVAVNSRRGPTVDRRCDVLVLGTGAAGLALAARLAVSGPPGTRRSVVLADQHAEPVTGRAWAYWSARRTPLDDAVSHSWDRLAVVADDRRLELSARPYTYRLVRGEDLQARVERLLEPGGFVRLTAAVHGIEETPDAAVVRIGDTEVRARWVLDSRPPPAPGPGQVRLRFLGWEVAADGARFDPGCATFMDFRARAAGEVRFCYVLPTRRDLALVEIAAFGTGPAARDDLSDGLAGYLQECCGLASWKVLRQEAGDLPLHVDGPRRAGPRVLRVGTAGGMLKPSTGYAFDRIVRDADAVVASLDRYGHPWALPPRRRRHAWLDDVLLGVVAREPAAVEPAFARMFARNPTARVLRFLDEETGLPEELGLMATLPPGPFLRAAVRRNRTRPAHRWR